MIVCVCQAVSDREIKKAISDGADTMRALRQHLGVATQCGQCACAVRELLDEHTETAQRPAHPPIWHPAT